MLLREGKTLANIGKLPLQWKIIFDFNPKGLLEASSSSLSSSSRNMIVIRTHSGYFSTPADPDRSFYVSLSYDPKGVLRLDPCWRGLWVFESTLESDQLLRTPEWSRIEITHEEGEEGRYFLSLSVNDSQPRRMAGYGPNVGRSGSIDDVKIVGFPQAEGDHREGFKYPLIRGLVVLGKQ